MSVSQFRKSEAVIDTSSLQCLMELDFAFPDYGLLQALGLRYYAIHIPRHVWNEIARHGRRRSQLKRLQKNHPLFKRCNLGDDYTAMLLYDRQLNPNASIDRGEAEAIIQARERGISVVFIDEKRGRKVAQAHTLEPRGIVGIIREFRLADLIPKAAPLFEECRRNRFRLPTKEVEEVLRAVGELPRSRRTS